MYQYSLGYSNSKNPHNTTPHHHPPPTKKKGQKKNKTNKNLLQEKKTNSKTPTNQWNCLQNNQVPTQCWTTTIFRQKPLSFSKGNTSTAIGTTPIISVFIYPNIVWRRIRHGVQQIPLYKGVLLHWYHYMSWHFTFDTQLPRNEATDCSEEIAIIQRKTQWIYFYF